MTGYKHVNLRSHDHDRVQVCRFRQCDHDGVQACDSAMTGHW
jgi:formylmethanofuran dehydrogenase subunit E